MEALLAFNWAELGMQLLAIWGALKIIAAITPWTADDKVVNWVSETLKKFGILK